MNSRLRYVVQPWKQLSGMGNWSYAVLTEWIDRDGATPGSTPAEVFNSKDAAKQYARDQAAAWPYRSEMCYLTDAGKYVTLS